LAMPTARAALDRIQGMQGQGEFPVE